jgi:hypothetical protein
LVALGLVAVLGVGGAAYAYFTTTGAGSGDATAGTSTPLTFVANVTPDAGGIVPDGVPAAISFDVTNGGTAAQRVHNITFTGAAAFTNAGHGTPVPACDTSNFSVATVTSDETVPAGGPTTLAAPGSLVFADDGTNQDDCKGVSLVLSFTSN